METNPNNNNNNNSNLNYISRRNNKFWKNQWMKKKDLNLILILLVLLSMNSGINSHWINLHVWYEDPLLTTESSSSSSIPSPALLTTLTTNSNLSSSSSSTSSLHGMQQDSSSVINSNHNNNNNAYYVHSSQSSQSTPIQTQVQVQGLVQERQLPPCDQLHGLTQAQIDICLVFRDHMKAIIHGAKLGLSECRWQFRFNHWNCSSPPNLNEYYYYNTNLEQEEESSSLVSNHANVNGTFVHTHHHGSASGASGNTKNGVVTKAMSKKSSIRGSKSHKTNNSKDGKKKKNGGKKRSIITADLQEKLNKQFNSVWNSILKQGSKEVAFAHAVWSAAVTQSIARACRDGSLTSCSCGRTPRPSDLKKEWRWGGCGDNLQYGYKFATDFVDSREKGAVDSKIRAKSLVNLHNNEAGRRAVLRKTKIACKCHGVSGSCALVTCWHQIPTFREIGDYLKESYSKATLVKMNKRGRLQVKKSGSSIPSVHDLIYVENSPNYCVKNSSLGIFGQTGRVCNSSPDYNGPDACKSLCCNGAGYSTNVIKSSTRCSCKFVWCCSVVCQTCKSVQKVSSCN